MSDGYIGDAVTPAPDLIDVVVGVRGFGRSGHMLASPFQKDEWRGPERQAVCVPKRATTAAALVGLGQKPTPAASAAAQIVARQQRLPQHAAPHPDCSCGLYAYHDAEVEHLDLNPIVGVVVGWGTLMVHATGFRAEHLRVVALAIGLEHPGVAGERYAEVARRACAWWKVPLLEREQLVGSLSEFGSPVPMDLRPQDNEEETS
jgi:hypothetical protein